MIVVQIIVVYEVRIILPHSIQFDKLAYWRIALLTIECRNTNNAVKWTPFSGCSVIPVQVQVFICTSRPPAHNTYTNYTIHANLWVVLYMYMIPTKMDLKQMNQQNKI